MSSSTSPPSASTPRILIVCRAHSRKNKRIDYVGEHHLEWIQRFGGLPIIIPRTPSTASQLHLYLPMDGLLLIEGEDLSPEFHPYTGNSKNTPNSTRSTDDGIGREFDVKTLEEIRQQHPSDVCYDHCKDEIEWKLLKLAREEEIPILGICRGCQLLNVACGGTLYFDIQHQVRKSSNWRTHQFLDKVPNAIPHISYNDYDGYRHPLRILPNTPLALWYNDEIQHQSGNIIEVNSYHHQSVKQLADNLLPMAYSELDGVVEGVYDPSHFQPEIGKFCIGIQYHPERLGDEAHRGGGLKIYEAFITAARNFGIQRKKTKSI
ncbi:uncharacterized protein LOC129617824 [Condylostylus longicornis]|uniref:uncharacterized protein LOC129617824 n=1 Tax=Condylostylus longicornis TaxID=2530218 RepID=UPI00244DB8D4|nr:uncharacterized protein LOC129617824 [Condylostylus longicornis]